MIHRIRIFRIFGFWGGLIVIITAAVLNLIFGYGSDEPRIARVIDFLIAGVFWTLTARKFNRFRIVKKISSDKEEYEASNWPEQGDVPKQPHWWPDETPKGITKDSVGPRKHLR